MLQQPADSARPPPIPLLVTFQYYPQEDLSSHVGTLLKLTKGETLLYCDLLACFPFVAFQCRAVSRHLYGVVQKRPSPWTGSFRAGEQHVGEAGLGEERVLATSEVEKGPNQARCPGKVK